GDREHVLAFDRLAAGHEAREEEGNGEHVASSIITSPRRRGSDRARPAQGPISAPRPAQAPPAPASPSAAERREKMGIRTAGRALVRPAPRQASRNWRS